MSTYLLIFRIRAHVDEDEDSYAASLEVSKELRVVCQPSELPDKIGQKKLWLESKLKEQLFQRWPNCENTVAAILQQVLPL